MEMKEELEIKKNKLDLKHQVLLQKLNALYAGLFVGIISFIAAWIFQPSYYLLGIVMTTVAVIWLTSLLIYTKNEIKGILKEIDSLLEK